MRPGWKWELPLLLIVILLGLISGVADHPAVVAGWTWDESLTILQWIE